MSKFGYARIIIAADNTICGRWPKMTALEIYNRLLTGVSLGIKRSTTERRLWALDIFRRQFSLRLGELLAELCAWWPHWEHKPAAYLDIDGCCREIGELFVKLEKSGHPAALDAWRPTTRRGQNIARYEDRAVRRFLDPGVYGRPQGTPGGKRGPRPIKRADSCRIHADKRATNSPDICCSCYQRLLKARHLGIITDTSSPAMIDAILKVQGVRGRYSTLIQDMREVAKQYENRPADETD